MTWLDFVVLTLAGSALADVWFNGSIFAEWREFFRAKQHPEATTADDEIPEDAIIEPPSWLMRLADRFTGPLLADLLSCPYCFSYHTPVWCGLFFCAGFFLDGPWGHLAKMPCYCLAATRLGNILNASLPKTVQYGRQAAAETARSPRSSDDPLPGR